MPYADPAVRRAKHRAQKAELRRYRPFIGVDGEGGNVGPCRDCECPTTVADGSSESCGRCGHAVRRHRHDYLLLRVGESALFKDNRRLTTEECLDFLCDVVHESHIPVAYFFDYDVTKILADLPFERANRLIRGRAARTVVVDGRPRTLPLDWHGKRHSFQLEYLPRKEFKVRRREKSGWGRWVTISDVGTFFQCPFVKALDDWTVGSAEVRASIAADKGRRDSFTHMTTHEIKYNHLEVTYLELLMEAFREAIYETESYCHEQGIDSIRLRPDTWQGPGRIAAAMLQSMGIPERTVSDPWPLELPPAVSDLATDAYYGGRFEVTAVGEFHFPVYQSDINSAYPDAMQKLPCLRKGHGRWRRLKRRPTDGSLWIAPVHFSSRQERSLYGFPVRDLRTGGVYFPREGNGVYWSPEIEAAEALGMTATVTVRPPVPERPGERELALELDAAKAARMTAALPRYGPPGHELDRKGAERPSERPGNGTAGAPAGDRPGGELRAAERPSERSGAGGPVVYAYRQTCGCPAPFWWVPTVYRMRQQLDAEAKRQSRPSDKGKVLKLALNSLYGKLCQSIGKPRFANPVYAGLITAHTRAKLLDAARSAPDGTVLMMATDAVFTTKPLDLPGVITDDDGQLVSDGKRLGEWDPKRFESFFIVQPGLYIPDSEQKSKTRGIAQKLFITHAEKFRTAWREWSPGPINDDHPAPSVTLMTTLFCGARIALARDAVAHDKFRWERDAGSWFDEERVVSFDWRNKRHPVPDADVFYLGHVMTRPYAGGPDLVSAPYREDIGQLRQAWALLELARLEHADQPDGLSDIAFLPEVFTDPDFSEWFSDGE